MLDGMGRAFQFSFVIVAPQRRHSVLPLRQMLIMIVLYVIIELSH